MLPRYTKVGDDESRASTSDDSHDTLLGSEHLDEFQSQWWLQMPLINCTGLVLAIVLIGVSNVITALAVQSYFASPPGTLTETSLFSPVHNWIKIPLVDKKIDNSPAPNASNTDHIYRLPPSEEVDAAWDRITDNPIFAISRDDVIKMQKDPGISVITPEEWGIGNDEAGNPKYLVQIDAFHQLHCLNALRKGLIHNYDYYWGHMYEFVPPVNFERHLNHCLDILRQTLMCHADVEAITYNWRETQLHPYADFGVHRQCKDWDTLLEWSKKNRLPDMARRFAEYFAPEDAVQLEAPPNMGKVGEDGVMLAPPGSIVRFIRPITGLSGVDYCLRTNHS